MEREEDAAADRFCRACGAELIDGVCPSCAPVLGDERRERSLVLRRSGFIALIALAMLITATTLAAQRGDLRQVRRAQRAAAVRIDLLERQRRATEDNLDRTTKRVGAMSRRLAVLEAAALGSPSTAKTAADAQRSVFTVQTDDKLGTAWVVSSDAKTSTLVTNEHVVSPLREGSTVEIVRDDLTFSARITFVDAEHDLALVVTDHAFPELGIQETKPAPGSAVVIVGSPLGLGGSVSTGVVSAVRTERGTELIQFTAPISPGNSGGPVLDERGDVVGIAVEKVVDEAAEGIGFAIPVEQLCRITPAC